MKITGVSTYKSRDLNVVAMRSMGGGFHTNKKQKQNKRQGRMAEKARKELKSYY